MALRLAGERALVIQGTDNQGWVREVTIQDSLPGLKINQKGAGRILDFQDGGVSKMYLPDGGNVSLVGSLVFDLANDVTITPANPGAPRILTINDPGGDDTFVFLAATQTLTGKTLTAPAISQVVFPATQVPSADANTLDDYEEGTWTPGLTFGGAAVGMTFGDQVGRYTKIGNRVVASGRLVLTAKGSSVGAAKMTGFPFATANISAFYQMADIDASGVTFANILVAGFGLNSAILGLEETTEAGVNGDLADTDFVDTSSVRVIIAYQV